MMRDAWEERVSEKWMKCDAVVRDNEESGAHVREQLSHDASAAGVRADHANTLQANA